MDSQQLVEWEKLVARGHFSDTVLLRSPNGKVHAEEAAHRHRDGLARQDRREAGSPGKPTVKRIGSKKTKQNGEKKSPDKSAGTQMTGPRANLRRVCDNFFKVILWLQIGIVKGHPLTVVMLQVGQP